MLNRAGVAFVLKVVDNPAAFVRCDAAVLYLAGFLQPELRQVVADCAPHLRATVPAFAKPLAAGVAVGEHRASLGGSFGSSRCRLVAEGIVDAYERRARDLDTRLEAVERRFAASGLSLRRPVSRGGIGRRPCPLRSSPTAATIARDSRARRSGSMAAAAGWARCRATSAGRSGAAGRTPRSGPISTTARAAWRSSSPKPRRHSTTTASARPRSARSASATTHADRVGTGGLHAGRLGIAYAAARVAACTAPRLHARTPASLVARGREPGRRPRRLRRRRRRRTGAARARRPARRARAASKRRGLLGDVLIARANRSAAGWSWAARGARPRPVRLRPRRRRDRPCAVRALRARPARPAFATGASAPSTTSGRGSTSRRRVARPARHRPRGGPGRPGARAPARGATGRRGSRCRARCAVGSAAPTPPPARRSRARGRRRAARQPRRLLALPRRRRRRRRAALRGRRHGPLAGPREIGQRGIDRHPAAGRGFPCGCPDGRDAGLLLGLAGIGLFYLRLPDASMATPLIIDAIEGLTLGRVRLQSSDPGRRKR